jgi:probable rRNA maturation factor
MPVDVSIAVGVGLDVALIERAARLVLDAIGRGDAELAVSLVDDGAIRELNRRYRGKDAPTDVLSFAQSEGEPLACAEPDSLGDVVISVETARRQAERGGWTLDEELHRLLLHGVLHLVGHDHERGGAEARRMQAEERRLAAVLEEAGIACACEDLA